MTISSKKKFFKNYLALFVVLVSSLTSTAFGSVQNASFKLVTYWKSSGRVHELKYWSLDELVKLKRTHAREKDPQSGRILQWEGVVLSQLVDSALEKLPLENRAQVDLVILKGDAGDQAIIPRSFINKYPFLLAYRWSSGVSALSGFGPLFSVVPWTSKPGVFNEDLPIEKYFVKSLSKIELASYRELYGQLYLKRRTDPFAMRGEKLYVQNCVSCHQEASTHGPTSLLSEEKTQKFLNEGHPPLTAMPLRLTDRDRRSVLRYFEAYRVENINPPQLKGVKTSFVSGWLKRATISGQ